MKCYLALLLCCSSLALVRTQAVTCTATDVGLKCDTCTDGVMCSKGQIIGPYTCPPDKSFCDTTACTTVKPANCAATTTTFECTSEGYFPDPSVCSNYHYCSAIGATPVTASCTVANHVYDALEGQCVKKHHDSQCVTMKCETANAINTIVHPANPKYYAYCDKDLKLTLFKCEENQQYDAGCVYVCKAKGVYPGKTADEYYQCTKNSLHKWTATTKNCPPGLVFSATATNNCVKAP